MQTTPRGKKVWQITPCPSGFGEYQSSGAVFVRKDSIQKAPQFDGLIHNQTGPAVTAETWDGETITAMLP